MKCLNCHSVLILISFDGFEVKFFVEIPSPEERRREFFFQQPPAKYKVT